MARQQNILFKRILLAIIGVTGWFALVAQLYLIIINRKESVPETIIRYFSFFTIITNILVAICATILLLKSSKANQTNFFTKQKTITATAVYIVIVGLVYNIILRQLWQPEGLQLIVDELLHSVIPVLFLLLWLIFIPKDKLIWTDVLPWLMFPLIYIIYILIRGKISGFYPYPFIDAGKLGLTNVLLNSGGLMIIFLGFSLLFVFIGKKMKRKSGQ